MPLNEKLLETTLAGLGYELIASQQMRDGLLRLTIDAPAGIALADCERVTRHLENLLPVEGLAYERLEVSSPGPNRQLTKPAHFTRFRGQAARVNLREPQEGQSRFTGMIAEANDDGVELECQAGRMRFAYATIASASLHDGSASEQVRT